MTTPKPKGKGAASRRRPARGGFGEFDVFDGATPPSSPAADPDAAEPPPAPADPAPAPVKAVEPVAKSEKAVEPEYATATLAVQVARIPDPVLSESQTTELTAEEEQARRLCEDAWGQAELSFVVQGKAMHTFRDGRLYRNTHMTFDLYCRDVLETSARRVNQRIEAWELGLALWKVAKGQVNERQVRALRPYRDKYGEAAAVALYLAIERVNGRASSTAVEKVVRTLHGHPDDHLLDECVRTALQGVQVRALPEASDSEADVFDREEKRLRDAARRFVVSATVRPERAVAFAGTLRSLADQVERSAKGREAS